VDDQRSFLVKHLIDHAVIADAQLEEPREVCRQRLRLD